MWWPFGSSSEDADDERRFKDFDVEVDYPHDWVTALPPGIRH